MGVIALALVSCTTLPAPTNLQVVKPDYIQRMEGDRSTIEIIRYENDGKTLWVWVDNKTMAPTCDYVVVVGIINIDKDEFKMLSIYNTAGGSSDGPDPCGRASKDYDEYIKVMKEMPGSEMLPGTLPGHNDV